MPTCIETETAPKRGNQEYESWKKEFRFAGHTYQPPRTFLDLASDQRVDLGEIWNERIWDACYKNIFETPRTPDVRAIPQGGIFSLFGTLREWWKDAHPEGWNKVVENISAVPNKEYYILGDPYLHPIMPFLPEEDQDMLVKIGKKAFEEDLGFTPKGFWLPETAIAESSLRAIKKNGYEFVTVVSSQVVNSETNPMYVEVHEEDGEYLGDLAVVHFNSGLSGGISYDDKMTTNGDDFLRQYGSADISYMTDTEFYNWHKKLRDYFIYYITKPDVLQKYGMRPFDLVNALKHSEKKYTKIVEGSAWSCPHQLGRWSGGCGCVEDQLSGAEFQKTISFRKELRQRLHTSAMKTNKALDTSSPGWRDDFITFFLQTRKSMYVQGDIDTDINRLIDGGMDRLENPSTVLLFKATLARLTGETSCAWFFGDVNRPEPQMGLVNAQAAETLLDQASAKDDTSLQDHILYQANTPF